MAQQGYGLGLGRTPPDIFQNSLANRLKPAKTYYTRPRRRRWKQLVLTSWLSVGAIRDGRRRRLAAATGREVPGAGVLHTAL